ncbi:histidine phosphatase family protein [Rhizobium sp. 32-5/1]|uniref:histidine phosphatase family protein n=1 Tax=Rhizobium sp. 32-5/1 TaxID=3019602 RepID=UPI00240E6B71|nr:histidine phosphatase family protein [Rhizobium sp. 32-5/1]WEZ83964.1 histidine phosphatase family protein [Rhizobium sp. 32-5/1]
MRRFQSMVCGLFLLWAGPTVAHAADGWLALRAPGTHALMRHAQAPGTGDPDDFRLGDCTTQRNLDEIGRTQARAAGATIRANNVHLTLVLASQWCRAMETARLLGFGPVEEAPQLNSFFADRSTRASQTEAIVARLQSAPPTEKLMLVTHQVNITALTGIVPRSGEITVISVSAEGIVTVEGRIAAPALR